MSAAVRFFSLADLNSVFWACQSAHWCFHYMHAAVTHSSSTQSREHARLYLIYIRIYQGPIIDKMLKTYSFNTDQFTYMHLKMAWMWNKLNGLKGCPNIISTIMSKIISYKLVKPFKFDAFEHRSQSYMLTFYQEKTTKSYRNHVA